MKSVPWFLWVIVAALTAAAIARWPYGYYTFMRIIVCGFCGYLAYLSWTEQPPSRGWSLVLGTTAIVFNPLIPLHLNRGIWFWFNIAAAAIIIMHLIAVRLRKV